MATQQELADHLDLSPERIRQLCNKGSLPKPKGRGGYDIDRCRLAYIDYLRGAASRGGEPSTDEPEEGRLDLTEERAKLARAQTEERELKVAELRGELIPAQACLEHWSGQHARVKSHLRVVPHQYVTAYPETTPEQADSLRRLIERACSEYSDGLPPGTGSSASEVEGDFTASA